MTEWSIIPTETFPTLCIINDENKKNFAYSKYNPEKEINRWISSLVIEEEKQKIILIGMGLGYHVEALRAKYPEKTIVVWELSEDYYNWFGNSEIGFRLHRTVKNLEYRLLGKQNIQYSQLIDDISNIENELLILRPLLELVPDWHTDLKDILLYFEVNKRSYKAHEEKMIYNFYKNLARGNEGIVTWLNKFTNESLILVSAGPSLTRQLPLLVEIKKNTNAIIGCVGTALSPLLLSGIEPDFIMISESNENLNQFQHLKNDKIPLFYLSTANHHVLDLYPGPKYIVWQKGLDLAENEAIKRSEPLINTGGSVATCLLDLMVNMKAKSIALVGQDLAFTNNMSHAAETHDVQTNIRDTTISVDAYHLDGKVSTSRNLFIYLKWFENYIQRTTSETILWNCTEGGAHIKGWYHGSLWDYKKEFLA